MARTPAPAADTTRTESIRTRVTPDELATVQAHAAREGRTVADVIRRATLTAARTPTPQEAPR